MPPSPASASRAIVVLGMHRSGTSVLTRSLRGLGVDLGDDFLSAKFDNPTGYWENSSVVFLNERLLTALGIDWEDTSLIEDDVWRKPEVLDLIDEAKQRLRKDFLHKPLWGFKDPRTIRLLPFWRAVFGGMDIDDCYIVAIRNPLAVATSLFRRQGMTPATSHKLWLAYVVPFLHKIAERPFVVVDYDLFLDNPRAQLGRIQRALDIPGDALDSAEVELVSREFVSATLRHSYFSIHDFDTIPVISPLVREAYLRLYRLATDQREQNTGDFSIAWNRLRQAVVAPLAESCASNPSEARPPERQDRRITPLAGPETADDQIARQNSSQMPTELNIAAQCEHRTSDRESFLGTHVRLFVVIGAQRTGTNLLREVLNTNEQIAMLGEILSESSAPAHWDNYLRFHTDEIFPPENCSDAEALLDRYFRFVLFRIRNHWQDGDKSQCRAIGVDIKYNQLRCLAPANWNSAAHPFLLPYLESRGATLIHTTRRNVVHCAISSQIAAQRAMWHNYEGVTIDRRYSVDSEQCLAMARTIVAERDALAEMAAECDLVECCYEDLVTAIGSATAQGGILESPGPLKSIAHSLRVPCSFRYNGRLQKAINAPYSQVLLNKDALSIALAQTEFAEFATTLD
jgi:hypothetical protein